ncbi:MAG: peroxiredoxin-like family protein [Pseudomonadota bacterium]
MAKNDVDAIVERFLDHLASSGVGASGLRTGDVLPGFLLPNAEGKLISSDELLADGPLVVSFIRGNWCTICASEIDDLKRIQADIEAAGARIVVITPETGGAAERLKARHDVSFEVLTDVDSGVALTFGLLFRLDEAMRELFMHLGRDLPLFQGNDGWFLPVPATYVIDGGGVVRLAFVEPDYRVRVVPADIVDCLKGIGLPSGSQA